MYQVDAGSLTLPVESPKICWLHGSSILKPY